MSTKFHASAEMQCDVIPDFSPTNDRKFHRDSIDPGRHDYTSNDAGEDLLTGNPLMYCDNIGWRNGALTDLERGVRKCI